MQGSVSLNIQLMNESREADGDDEMKQLIRQEIISCFVSKRKTFPRERWEYLFSS